MKDVFEPRNEPAKSIYLAFQNEAKKRKGRSPGEWIQAEREAVYAECQKQADLLSLKRPSMAEVEAAERYAMGSIDYGAKWAYQLVRVMKPVEKSAD
jgi:hypothetical protein